MPSATRKEKMERAIDRKRRGVKPAAYLKKTDASVITSSLIKKICRVVARGNYETVAAQLNGLTADTLFQWKDRGKRLVNAQIEDEFCTRHDIMCKRLFLALEKAWAQAQDRLLTVISDEADNGNWIAAMTLLERRDPDRYGRNNIARGPGSSERINIFIELSDDSGSSDASKDDAIDVTPTAAQIEQEDVEKADSIIREANDGVVREVNPSPNEDIPVGVERE